MRRVHLASFIEFPIRTHKLEVAPKPWESTTEIGEIPQQSDRTVEDEAHQKCCGRQIDMAKPV
jgi:hypothetical protein